MLHLGMEDAFLGGHGLLNRPSMDLTNPEKTIENHCVFGVYPLVI